MSQLVASAPSVEVAAGTAESFIRICQSQFRSLEYLLRLKPVRRIIRVDTGIELMIIYVTGIYTKFIVTTIAKRCSYDTTVILLRLSVKRKHHLGMVCMRVARAVLILYHLHSPLKRLLHETAFSCPCSMKMAHPYISDTDRKIS